MQESSKEPLRNSSRVSFLLIFCLPQIDVPGFLSGLGFAS